MHTGLISFQHKISKSIPPTALAILSAAAARCSRVGAACRAWKGGRSAANVPRHLPPARFFVPGLAKWRNQIAIYARCVVFGQPAVARRSVSSCSRLQRAGCQKKLHLPPLLAQHCPARSPPELPRAAWPNSCCREAEGTLAKTYTQARSGRYGCKWPEKGVQMFALHTRYNVLRCWPQQKILRSHNYYYQNVIKNG